MNRLYQGLLLFGSTLLVGTLGYIAAGWPASESLYMVVITIFGVGYGEVLPIDTQGLRLFTMALILAGTISVLYSVGGFVEIITQGEINRAMGNRRMTREVKRMENHVIVCGFGRIGEILAGELAKEKMPFIIIDSDPEQVRMASDRNWLAMTGNATEEQTLLNAGIERARTVATVLSQDALNVFITLTARDLNSEIEIIARAEDPASQRKLRRSGANRVILPAVIGAERMAHMIAHPSAEELLGRSGSLLAINDLLSQIEMEIHEYPVAEDSPLAGAEVKEIEFQDRSTWLVVAVRNPDGSIRRNPKSDERIKAGDTVIAMGHRDEMPQLARRFAEAEKVSFRGTTV